MNLSPFAYSLFSSLATNSSDTNILISPFSIASALSMVLAGATKGSTCQEELMSVLRVSSPEELPFLSKSLIQSSSQSQKSVSLTNANGIWSKSLKDSYISLVQDIYNASAKDLPTTYEPISEYIANKTHGLIKNMMSGNVDPLTVAILVNAVHFKGDWTNKFVENATYPAKFTTLDGTMKDAKFMNATRRMKFMTDIDLLHGASIVQLDYGKQDEQQPDWTADYAALFVLPKEKGKSGINSVVMDLMDMHRTSSQSFDEMLQELSYNHQKVDLSIPRFRMQYGTRSLVNELKTLGLRSCFDGEAVLMEMSDDPLVHLDQVFHKAVMEVTEEGTEAAAATVGIVMTRSMPMPPPKLVFDRPFVMIVLHVPTKTPLFVARVDDPELMF